MRAPAAPPPLPPLPASLAWWWTPAQPPTTHAARADAYDAHDKVKRHLRPTTATIA
jgi:hypothetical protein